MKILYICTHNRCRSILSEALTNHLAGELITAKSAGSQPACQVHPLSIKYLHDEGVATSDLKSESWDSYEDFDADVVITVCDSAANEACPVWFSDAITLHWGLSDPSKVVGTDAEKAHAFKHCIEIISQRVEQLKDIAQRNLSNETLRTELARIGADHGAI